jgi:hypothetical protein
MPRKRFNAEQIVVLLRQIEVLMSQGKLLVVQRCVAVLQHKLQPRTALPTSCQDSSAIRLALSRLFPARPTEVTL